MLRARESARRVQGVSEGFLLVGNVDEQDIDNNEDSEIHVMAQDFDAVNTDELAVSGYRFSSGAVHILKADVERLFEFCLHGIVDMADTQFAAAPRAIARWNASKQHQPVPTEVKTIHIVGGFSTLPYVQGHLLRNLRFLVPRDKIVFGHRSIQVPIVATGGLYYGVNNDFMKTRVLRTNIGLIQQLEWEDGFPALPTGTTLELCPLTGERLAWDVIRVLWHKGDRIKQTEQRSFVGTYWIPCTGTFEVQEALYCINKMAPQYEVFLHLTTETSHWVAWSQESQSTLGIDEIGVLKGSVQNLENRPWTKQTGSRKMTKEGRDYFLCDYELVSIFEGLRHKLKVRIPTSGHFNCKNAGCPGGLGSGTWRKCQGKTGQTQSALNFVEFDLDIKAGQTLANGEN